MMTSLNTNVSTIHAPYSCVVVLGKNQTLFRNVNVEKITIEDDN